MTLYLVGTVLAFGLFDTLIVDRLPEFGMKRFEGLSDSIVQLKSGDPSKVTDDTVATRLELYEVALDMFHRSPIIGNGTGSFPVEISDNDRFSDLYYPHNMVLQFASEYGLIGLVLFAIVTVSACKIVRGISNPTIFGLAMMFLATLFEAMISGGLDNRLFWGLTFLAIATPISDLRAWDVHSVASRQEV
jgi:O-antigen ligase